MADTASTSPRAASMPRPPARIFSIFVSSAGVQALPSAALVALSTTATDSFFRRPRSRLICVIARSYAYWRVVAFLRALPSSVFSAGGAPAASAVAGAGGRFDSVPGTPIAMRLFSISSRMASLVTFGASPYFSWVSSTRSLSTAAVTLTL